MLCSFGMAVVRIKWDCPEGGSAGCSGREAPLRSETTHPAQDGSVSTPTSLFPPRRAFSRKGAKGKVTLAAGLTSQGDTTICIKRPYPDHPHWDGETPGAGDDSTMALTLAKCHSNWPNAKASAQLLGSFQGLLAAQIPSKESRSLPSLIMALGAEAKL